jgi:enoyl-CoA hydratase/carnithine racemase
VTAAVSVWTEGHVHHVRMERPAVRNALSNELKAALVGALDEFEKDDSLRVMVLGACDCGAFSAGGDLGRVVGRLEQGLPIADPEAPDLFLRLEERRKPIIAAIDGHALGGGLELALACDMRVATRASTFGLPEPRVGLVSPYALHRLSRVIPLGEALKLQLSGTVIDGVRAHEIGLVQDLGEDRAAMQAVADRLARQVARCSPDAVRTIRHLLKIGRHLPVEEADRMSTAERDKVNHSPEALEGVRSFMEKRAPRWST